MAPKPKLKIFDASSTEPTSCTLRSEASLALWRAIMSEYQIDDRCGIEMLAQACAALDRLAALTEAINNDGVVLYSKTGSRVNPAVREETALRIFVVRTLEKLGLNAEALKRIGRPARTLGYFNNAD